MLERLGIVKMRERAYSLAKPGIIMAKRLKLLKKKQETITQPEAAEVEFDYIKSNFFRVIQMDGAFGGLNPGGTGIHMAIYNERRAIPTKTVQPLNVDGTLGPEIPGRRESRKAFVRQIEVDLALDLPTAIVLQTWLAEKIAQCAKAQGLSQEQLQDAVEKATAARDGVSTAKSKLRVR